MQKIAALFLMAFVMMTAVACAAPQSFTATGIYIMGDNDSPKIAKAEARKDALRQITEQAGVYTESYSRTQDKELTHDEVQMISASIVKVIHEGAAIFAPDGNGMKCMVEITATADISNINFEAILQHKTVLQTAEQIQANSSRRYDELAERYAYAGSAERSDIDRIVNANEEQDFILQEAAKAIATGNPKRAYQLLKVNEYNLVNGPNDFFFRYFFGVALYDMGDIKGANKVFSAIENNYNKTHKEMFRVRYYLGIIAYQEGYYQRAYNCLQFAWNNSPQDDDAMKDWYIKAYEAYAGDF